MLNLVVKDILVQKKSIILSFIYILFIIFTFQKVGPLMFPAGIVAFVYMLVLTSCAYEDKNNADIMVNSLPIRRSEVVLAKYISVFVFLLLGTVAYVVLTGIVNIVQLPFKTYPITLEGFLGAALSVSVIAGIYFPLFFKNGYIRSKVANFIIFFGFFFGITSLINVFKNNENSVLIKSVTEFFISKPDYINIVIIIAFISILNYISYILSVRFYTNREF